MLSGGGIPRWARALAGVLACAVAVGLLATEVHRRHGPPAAAHPTTSTAPTPAPAVFDPAQAVDIVAGRSWWLLEGGALARLDPGGVVRTVPLSGLGLPEGSSPQLAVDEAAQRVWLVVADAAPSRIVEYDARTLRRIREVIWPEPVRGAVAYAGHLYLSSDLGVADLAPGARAPHVVPGLVGAVGPVAVDPTRHRLIAIDLGTPTDVWSYVPGRRPVEAGTPLDLGKGSLAVVQGRIWVGGFGPRGAVLLRLDPRTLLPAGRGDAQPFGPGPELLAGGARVFWVRPGDRSGVLACVSGTTGRTEQRWSLAGYEAVASTLGSAQVATAEGLLRLVLVGCSG